MMDISQLDRNLSQEELNNFHGGLNFFIEQGVKAIGRYFGGKIAEDFFGQGGAVSDATLTGHVTNPAADFSIDNSVTLTPFEL